MADEQNRRTSKCTSKEINGTTATWWRMPNFLTNALVCSWLCQQPRPGEPGNKSGNIPITNSRKLGFPSAFPISISWKAWLPFNWWINPAFKDRTKLNERGKTVYYNDCSMDSCSRISVRRDWCTVVVLFTIYFCQKVSSFKLQI